jgi:hypothetical protein
MNRQSKKSNAGRSLLEIEIDDDGILTLLGTENQVVQGKPLGCPRIIGLCLEPSNASIMGDQHPVNDSHENLLEMAPKRANAYVLCSDNPALRTAIETDDTWLSAPVQFYELTQDSILTAFGYNGGNRK